MSTKRQLKAMFSAVLDAHPDARYIDGRIYVRPISQVAWIIALGTTSIAEIYHLSWGPSALFVPDGGMASLRFPIMIPKPKAPWAVGARERVLHAVEEQCLSRIPAQPTLDDLYKLGESEKNQNYSNIFDIDPARGVFYYSAQGEIDRALEMSEQLFSETRGEPLEKLTLALRVLFRDLHPLLLTRDRQGIGALLRQIEQRCVVSHKLEKFWEPAPYPVELQV